MSDNIRKDFSTKAKEAITPESEKGIFDKVKETVTNAVDSVAEQFQNHTGEKGTIQNAADKVSNAVDQQADNADKEAAAAK